MNLYQIDERLTTLIEEGYDLEWGTIFESEEELAKAIDEVALDLDTKIENIGLYIKNLEAEATMIKNEEDNLEKRRKANERKIEGLKRYLNSYLTAVYPKDEDRAKWKFKSPRVVLGYRKSSKVEILDESKINDKYVNYVTERKIDRDAIKRDIKNGKEVEGAFIKQNINLNIK